MNPVLKVEVEPLSDARWARIEQSLLERLEELPPASRQPASLPARSLPARMRATPRVLAFASAAAFAMVAAIALFVLKPWSSVHEAISRVATEASPSHVTIGDASIDLSPESGIVVREEEHATVLVLERGEVALHIAPRPKDRPFLVDAGEVRVRVVGTEFSVRRAGVSAVVTVRKGIVEVTARGEVSRLTAGDSWPDQAAATLGVLGAANAPSGNAGAAGAFRPLQSPTPATPAVTTAWTAAAQAQAEAPRTHGAVVSAHSASARRAAARAAVAATAAQATSTTDSAPAAPSQATSAAPAAPALAVAPPDDPAAVPAASPAPPASNEPSSQARYEAAEQIERKDPDRALRAYTALAHGSDVWAQDALFAAGRLQADRGARTDATRLLEEYLRRFPRGPNAQDAQSLRESLR